MPHSWSSTRRLSTSMSRWALLAVSVSHPPSTHPTQSPLSPRPASPSASSPRTCACHPPPCPRWFLPLHTGAVPRAGCPLQKKWGRGRRTSRAGTPIHGKQRVSYAPVTQCLWGGPACGQKKAGSWPWERGGHCFSYSYNCHPSAHHVPISCMAGNGASSPSDLSCLRGPRTPGFPCSTHSLIMSWSFQQHLVTLLSCP